jgi:hypothetical protein
VDNALKTKRLLIVEDDRLLRMDAHDKSRKQTSMSDVDEASRDLKLGWIFR